MIYTEIMGFGADPEELLANPRRSPETYKYFYSSMAMIAEGLGKEIDNVTVKFEVSKAKKDIKHLYGEVKAGTVGGQHYEWTAWVRGRAADRLSLLLAAGRRSRSAVGRGRGRATGCVIKGDPPLECNLMGGKDADGRHPFLGLPWTGLVGCTVVPQVCDAAPGVVTHLDLGVVQPKGLVRR